MYVYIYVCMYVCMHVYICMHKIKGFSKTDSGIRSGLRRPSAVSATWPAKATRKRTTKPTWRPWRPQANAKPTLRPGLLDSQRAAGQGDAKAHYKTRRAPYGRPQAS